MIPTGSGADPRIQRARACLAEDDVPGARAILEELAAGAPGVVWAAARLELTALDHRGGDHAAMRAWLAPILAEASIDGLERAVALYWAAIVSEGLDEPIDLGALEEAIAGLETDEPYLAAGARMLRGRWARGAGQLERAVIDFSAAVGLYERAGSVLGPGQARLALADAAAATGDRARAEYELAAGLAWLARFPYERSARRLEDTLRQRRDRLAAT